LEAVAQTGRRGQFECVNLGNALPWPSGSFDLVVASYSLYYFVDVLADIPRLLRPTGLFLAITHSGTTFRALCRAAGIDEVCCPLLALIRRFSAENGGDLLRSWFARVERVEYRNELRFGPQDTEDLLRYVRFKLPLLWPKTPLSGEIPDDLRQRLTNTFRRDGRFIMDKNDAIFRCRARQGA
jgi:SAM-dependent methyltransferase